MNDFLLCVSCVAVQHGPTGGVHSLNDQMVQNHLLLCPLDDVLLHCPFGDQSVNIHLRRESVVFVNT